MGMLLRGVLILAMMIRLIHRFISLSNVDFN